MKVSGPKNLMRQLANRPEVERVEADRTFDLPAPTPAADPAPGAVEWNIDAINTRTVCDDLSVRGEGIVVANLDSGVQFDHPALVNQYRGNLGGSFDHNYSWFDPSKVCGNPSTVPCDNNRHGTHTMGTIVGDHGTGQNFLANQTIPNLVVAKVGADGKVALYNHAGSSHVIFDVVGWYSA